MTKTDTHINQLIDHLFRRESGKLVAVLTRVFGTGNIELAEDVVQDSLTEAIHQWTWRGVPDNPAAWLFTVAKNKALNILKREKYKKQYARFFQQEAQTQNIPELFSEQEIADDQLRMIFTCCHPALTPDSQVALTLKTLCGFGLSEIAKAFLSSEETIKKRLVRARQELRNARVLFEVPQGREIENRLDNVLETIYFLFNEGYSASKGNNLVRYELCEEAIRLAEIIATNPGISQKSKVYALLSLMHLNASRFNARQDEEGNILTLAGQDRSLWDYKLAQKGFYYLEKSFPGDQLSTYHILAAISGCHCSARDFASTDWVKILSLYDQLLLVNPSPIVMLNRAIALSKVKGVEKALDVLEELSGNATLQTYYLYHSTLAEFYIQQQQYDKAGEALRRAITLSRLNAERVLLQKKLDFCIQKISRD